FSTASPAAAHHRECCAHPTREARTPSARETNRRSFLLSAPARPLPAAHLHSQIVRWRNQSLLETRQWFHSKIAGRASFPFANHAGLADAGGRVIDATQMSLPRARRRHHRPPVGSKYFRRVPPAANVHWLRN